MRRCPGYSTGSKPPLRFCTPTTPPSPGTPGIYLFGDDDGPVYVGQTRNLRTRLRQHTSPQSKQNQASFAFNLAKRDANLADVPVTATRVALQIEERFAAHFAAAKAQVAEMRVQWIELEDPIERTLFEMYAALALVTTEFNSFETH